MDDEDWLGRDRTVDTITIGGLAPEELAIVFALGTSAGLFILFGLVATELASSGIEAAGEVLVYGMLWILLTSGAILAVGLVAFIALSFHQ